MRARVMVGAIALAGGTVMGIGSARSAAPGVEGAFGTPRPIAVEGARLGDVFRLPAAPAHQTPLQRKDWLLAQQALGRPPTEWVDLGRHGLQLPTVAKVAPPRHDLATEVVALSTLAGRRLTATERSQIASRAAAVPTAVRGPFADLVARVTQVYAAQVPLAATIAARIPHTGAQGVVVTPAERDLMIRRQQSVLSALATFRAQLVQHPESLAASGPTFTDPEGLVVLGGNGDDTYTRSGFFPDPVLLVDPAGNDTYQNSAGGACPVTINGSVIRDLPTPLHPSVGRGPWMDCNGLVVSVVADLGDPSNDAYSYLGSPSPAQGAAGPGGIGILLDVGGNDTYTATLIRTVDPPFFGYFDGGAQGFGYGGTGLLLDSAGDDIYHFNISTTGKSIWALGQGFGGAGGFGAAIDAAGNDQWFTDATGTTNFGEFEGLYTQGGGFFGGVGLFAELGGDDVYRASVLSDNADYYAQGFGAFGGVGILFEAGGDDNYFTSEHQTEAVNPTINPMLNCAFGTASFGGIGIAIDVSGNDSYYGEAVAPQGAEVMDWGWGGPSIAYGLFADTAGNDRYEEHARSTLHPGNPSFEFEYGLGYFEPLTADPNNLPNPTDPNFIPGLFETASGNNPVGENSWGTFVDVGGHDTYIAGAYNTLDNSYWNFGADIGG